MSEQTPQRDVTSREGALALLERVKAGAPASELAPYVQSLLTHDHEQTFAIMRGSGNEMSPSLQLLTLLAHRELITEQEVFEAEDARAALRDRDAA